MFKLETAFTTAWIEIKKVETGAASFVKEAASFVTANESQIQADVAVGSTILTVADPALAPEITVFDSVEEAVMGKLLALASDVTNAKTLEGLFGSAWPTIQSLVGSLSTHPAVVAAKAVAAK